MTLETSIGLESAINRGVEKTGTDFLATLTELLEFPRIQDRFIALSISSTYRDDMDEDEMKQEIERYIVEPNIPDMTRIDKSLDLLSRIEERYQTQRVFAIRSLLLWFKQSSWIDIAAEIVKAQAVIIENEEETCSLISLMERVCLTRTPPPYARATPESLHKVA